ncbi:MAG: 16S rRNA (guanine(966)-N(2))-methyltransferase RsmD [Thermoleophilia bacterium]
MRIVAGARRGARIAAPPGDDTRPTADRVREAAFNLLGPLDGAIVLDLFAGSGAMGLEALSRGAAEAALVERDERALAVIRRNVAKLGLPGARVERADALRFLAVEAERGRRYDLVVIDPPYRMLPDLLPSLSRLLPPILGRDALVLVESDARLEPELPLARRTTRRYGAARLSLFEAGA